MKEKNHVLKTSCPQMKTFLYYNHGSFHFKLELEGGLVKLVGFIDPNDAEASMPNSSHQYINKLGSYLSGECRDLELPHVLKTTEFAARVYAATNAIPPGETRTYGQIAVQIGSPRASRAVGAALRANPLPLIIPCHRVLGANGQLTGFAGGLELKRLLLELEKQQ